MSNKSQEAIGDRATLVAVDAPPEGSGERTGVWKRRLAPLMAPEAIGGWFRVFTAPLAQARTYKYNLEKGILKAPEGVFEYAAGPLPADEVEGENDGGVYARYLGEAEPEVEVEASDDDTED